MQQSTVLPAISALLSEQSDEFIPGCDPDFDDPESDLAHEFAAFHRIFDCN